MTSQDPQPKGAQLLAAVARRLRADFDSTRATNPHRGEEGRELEENVIEFLNNHLPRRFRATRGHVVDDTGETTSQIDTIIYDQLDAFVFRADTQALIVPSDNVAAVIEVKAKLDGAAVKDAAEKIAEVKRLKKLEPREMDQPLVGTRIVVANPRGTLFAYESAITLEKAAEHLHRVNSEIDSDHWIDEIVILDRGVVSFMMKFPNASPIIPYAGKTSSAVVRAEPVYVIPMIAEVGDLTLAQFIAFLQAHLAQFRRRPARPIAFFHPSGGNTRPAGRGYWFNSKSKLDPVPEHQPQARGVRIRTPEGPEGVVEWFPWADGHVVCFKGWVEALPVDLIRVFVAPYGGETRLTQYHLGSGLFMTDIRPGPVSEHFERGVTELREAHPNWIVDDQQPRQEPTDK